MSIKVSVITVVYNAGHVFEWTLKSVRDQKYDNIEYIVIDGGSTDNTLRLVENYKPFISGYISESDEGLYSAMNKGLNMATGDYVMFLNAGDIFYDDQVLCRVFRSSLPEADVYYGETMIMDKNGKDIGMRRLKAPEQLTWKSFINGMVVCHQAIIAKRSIVSPYNTGYRIASDYNWVLQILKKAGTICNTNMVLIRFLEGGINKSNILRALWERFRIMVKEFGFFPVFFQHFIIAGRFIIFIIRNRRF